MNTESAVRLGTPPPTELSEARLILHLAVQPLAAAAYALLPARDDHTQSSIVWDAERRRFVGHELPLGRRTFLDPLALRLGVQDEEGREVASFPVVGATLEELFADLAEVLDAPKLSLPTYDLPDSPLTSGARFAAPEANALEELVRWFELGFDLLPEFARARLNDAPLRGWPHHFDFAALHSLDPDLDPEKARSINVGLSPGDCTYDEPYLYVTPYPAPKGALLPPVPHGHWHTEGYTAAILPGSELAAAGSGAEQRAVAEAFLGSATDASFTLLER